MPGINEIKISKLTFFILLITITVSCQKNESTNFIKIHALPNAVHEISGIAKLPNNGTLYAINDSGNDNTLFAINEEGKIASKIKIKGAKNTDWEDLAYDQENNIYIGDFGNNHNQRKDLRVFKVSGILSNDISVSTIKFTFEDQKKFPPKKKNLNFDVEAFIYLNGSLYLFTKNRSSKFTGTTKLYKLPAVSGEHVAQLIGSYDTCDDPNDCFITGATINRSRNKIVLLTYNKLFVLSDFTPNNLFDGTIKKIKLNHYSQKEGICFKNDSILYITDEKMKHKKAGLYEYRFD
ncbi:SdiA-regulated domain-containing protein [Aquimarina sp. 2304DJ70-9]|uniref:SdiA-regulated domain-containing protein n=1 Tax=Aquimarina penaris TaxID=3231044 RepID=UPI003461B7EE